MKRASSGGECKRGWEMGGGEWIMGRGGQRLWNEKRNGENRKRVRERAA